MLNDVQVRGSRYTMAIRGYYIRALQGPPPGLRRVCETYM